MSKRDAIIDRLRALSVERQDGAAAWIAQLLEPTHDALDEETWALIEARLDTEVADVPHEDVLARFSHRLAE